MTKHNNWIGNIVCKLQTKSKIKSRREEQEEGKNNPRQVNFHSFFKTNCLATMFTDHDTYLPRHNEFNL